MDAKCRPFVYLCADFSRISPAARTIYIMYSSPVRISKSDILNDNYRLRARRERSFRSRMKKEEQQSAIGARQYTFTLPNGLRIVCEERTTDVLYCGYIVKAGTRHEEDADSGLAHFLEHLSFKGTARRRSWQITNGLERVGGDLNAFTNKQETAFTAIVLREDFTRAADLLTDIVFRSAYPQKEMDREVEVVCDEIDSYRDQPGDLIFDEFEAMLFRGHGLGRDILGSKERLHAYRTADALRHARRWYVPQNAVFYVYGQIDFKRVVRTLERLTADLPSVAAPVMDQTLPAYVPEVRKVKMQTHQAHVLIGARALAGGDPRRHALSLLTNILGGPGMNARLNVRLREKAGLVYSVDATYYAYPDTGVWQVYFGCDEADVGRCRRLVVSELRRMAEHPLSPTQLAAAKKQYCGQTGIACSNAESYALALGKAFAHYERVYSIRRKLEHVRDVTADELCSLASELLNEDRLTTLIYN